MAGQQWKTSSDDRRRQGSDIGRSGDFHSSQTGFQYDWTVRDGSLITFTVMDLFTFDPESDKVASLDLIYDTHPIRATYGNKYDLPLAESDR
jgi:hypothetical protein